MTSSGLSFTILGPLTAWRDSSRIHLGPARQREVLTALLLRRGSTVALSQLAADVWGDSPPRGVDNVIHTYVSRLRRMLGSPGRAGAGGVLRSDRPGYTLVIEHNDLDIARFEGLVRRGRSLCARMEFDAARELLTDAARLWYGPPLHGATGPLAEAERTRLTALRQEVATELAAVRLRLDEGTDLVPELRRMLVEQPLNEPLWGLLMAALQRAARRAEAMHAYQQARAVLSERLGVEPGEELQRLHMQLLRGEPVAVPGRWTAAACR